MGWADYQPDEFNSYAELRNPTPRDEPEGNLAPNFEKGGHLISAIAKFFGLGDALEGGWSGRSSEGNSPMYGTKWGEAPIADILGNIDLPAKGATAAVPVLGQVFMEGRPWLRNKIAQAIGEVAGSNKLGRKWLTKYSEDRPGKTVASEAFKDYAEATGTEPATFGIEWEGRSPLRRSELQSKLPSGYEAVSEPAMSRRSYNPATGKPTIYKNPSEIINKEDSLIEGLEGIENFDQWAGPRIQQALGGTELVRAGEPMFKGGVHGGGGHLNVSWPQLRTQPGQASAAFAGTYAEAEPWLYPPVPSYKQSGERQYVKPFLEFLRGLNPEQFEKRFGTTAGLTRGPGMGPFPSKFESALNLDNLVMDPQNAYALPTSRLELRGFYSPENHPEWTENMLLVQSLIDKAQHRMHLGNPFGVGRDEFLQNLFKTQIEPNNELLNKIREVWHGKQGSYPSRYPLNEEAFGRWTPDMPERERLQRQYDNWSRIAPELNRGLLQDAEAHGVTPLEQFREFIRPEPPASPETYRRQYPGGLSKTQPIRPLPREETRAEYETWRAANPEEDRRFGNMVESVYETKGRETRIGDIVNRWNDRRTVGGGSWEPEGWRPYTPIEAHTGELSPSSGITHDLPAQATGTTSLDRQQARDFNDALRRADAREAEQASRRASPDEMQLLEAQYPWIYQDQRNRARRTGRPLDELVAELLDEREASGQIPGVNAPSRWAQDEPPMNSYEFWETR